MPLFPERWAHPYDVCSQKAIIEATMHFPMDVDIARRKQLACFYDFHRSVWIEDDELVEDTYSRRHVFLAYNGRDIDELGSSDDQILSRSYYAAHWLRYRLWAHRHHPDQNSNNRWEYYVEEDVIHKLPSHWIKGRTKFVEARKEFASVAHLWLARFDWTGPGLTPFHREGVERRPSPLPRPGHYERFLRRANGYFLAARVAGLYGDRPGQFPLEDVWQLDETNGADPVPELETPDGLVPDFDPEWYRQRYVPRAERFTNRNQI